MRIAFLLSNHRHTIGHSQSLLDMKVPLFSVSAHTSVIAHPVCDIGILLNLCG